MDEIGKLLEHLGYATPVIYAAAAYGLFAWLDKEASDEAKGALANTMRLKSTDSKQVAAALVEVFDRIYTYPLLRWRAFARSTIFTIMMTILYSFEIGFLFLDSSPKYLADVITVLTTNVFMDYASLFMIRRWLFWSGTRPIFALLSGTLLALLLIVIGGVFRYEFVGLLDLAAGKCVVGAVDFCMESMRPAANFALGLIFVPPTMVVFLWLPLFALGIFVVRAFAPLSWAVEKARWFLKDGEEHPLKAIGYISGLFVFVFAAILKTIFKA